MSASAIGLYGYDRGDAALDESASKGDGFLADTSPVGKPRRNRPGTPIRTVTVRTGIVQTPRGAALPTDASILRRRSRRSLGSGRQWLSWIDIDDLVDVYHRVFVDPAISGPVNAVSPQPARNDEYTRTLARVLRRPALLPVPESARTAARRAGGP